MVLILQKRNNHKCKMNQKHHYTGLTDAQVLESRQKYGVNVLTPPEKESLWDTFKETCTHWIAISMLALIVISTITAGVLCGGMGVVVWSMPAIIAFATVLILVVGFFGGFEDPLFKILIMAFVLSIGISIYEFVWGGAGFKTFFEPIGIIVALVLATSIAFFLERSNEKTFQSLNEVNDDTLIKVIRNNNVCQVPRKDIVVGDIVLLESGEEIPADCELLESLNLSVNESSLTGELQAAKTTNPEMFDKEATYASNLIMKGTVILEGYCTAKVFAVGDKTESGKVFEAAQVDEGGSTPLSEELDGLADLITKASYVFAALIVIGRLFIYFYEGDASFATGDDWISFITYVLNTIMIAVTLIVVAVPEGLPMSVTLSLAFSMRKLMKENTLPRTMHSCETMGATSVICTDKTGTLTQNQMQVADTKLSDVTDDFLTEMISVNTTANLDLSDKNSAKVIGNPTEGALLLWLKSKNVDYLSIRENAEIIDRLPFSTENKYMATVVKSVSKGRTYVFVKGAPEILLGMSAISEADKETYGADLLNYQNKAMRTLGLAYTEVRENEKVIENGKLNTNGLTFVGIFAISDPIRKEVPAAIKECLNAGVQVKIVTGDTSGTAKEIGRQIGLWNEKDTDKNILTGSEFAAMSDEELKDRVVDIKILSRARPNDKERLVKLLKQRGQVVAATGDGTNDAPALNAADVGLSMGDGTAVAKESSDMTIQDNSFSTIANAVMWGRSLYKNIQRFLLFQLTVNVTACFLVLVGAFMGTESPLTVTQMLWINLIMDTFAAIALASLPPSRRVMEDKPRDRNASILSKPMRIEILGVGFFFFFLLVAMLYIFEHGEYTSMCDLFFNLHIGERDGLSTYELTLLFTTFVMTHFFYLFNARAFETGKSALHFKGCQGLLAIVAVIFLGQVAMVEIPLLQDFFNVCGLTLEDWVIIILGSSLVLWIREIWHLITK
jgi:Ca2+-transporting ATPase